MTARSMSVLILGGYGTFGGRLAQLLADESGLKLIIAGARWKGRWPSAAVFPARQKPCPVASTATAISKPSCVPRAAIHELELADYAPLFARRAIYTGWRQVTTEMREAPLYCRIRGDAWDELPPPLHAMHSVTGEFAAEGVAIVERGSGALARFLAMLVGFPQNGSDVPVEVVLSRRRTGEVWQRRFADRRCTSVQDEGRGRFERLVIERFGPVAFGFALVLDGECLRLVLRRWCVLGLTLPLAWAPHADAFESAPDGRFHFHVGISHKLTGPIIAYRSWLVPRSARLMASVRSGSST